MPKGLKDWQAFLDLKKKIDDFSECCPLLELMANKAMKERHWDRIANCTKHTFDFESDGFSLRNIMEAPLLENKEDIEVIISASPFKSSCTTTWHLPMVHQSNAGVSWLIQMFICQVCIHL